MYKFKFREPMKVKCKIERPREYYEDKLNFYEAEYEKAKRDGDQKYAHKLRANLSQTRARLRDWDERRDEHLAYVERQHKYMDLQYYYKVAKDNYERTKSEYDKLLMIKCKEELRRFKDGTGTH